MKHRHAKIIAAYLENIDEMSVLVKTGVDGREAWKEIRRHKESLPAFKEDNVYAVVPTKYVSIFLEWKETDCDVIYYKISAPELKFYVTDECVEWSNSLEYKIIPKLVLIPGDWYLVLDPLGRESACCFSHNDCDGHDMFEAYSGRKNQQWRPSQILYHLVREQV